MHEPPDKIQLTVKSPASPSSALLRSVAAFALTLAAMYLVFGRVHVLFFRGESGWMLLDAQHGWPGILARMRFAFTTSYNGHYTPLIFVLELLCAGAFRTHEAWWRLHQFVLMTGLALGMWSVFGRAARYVTGDRSARWAIRAASSAVFLFSPVILDYVGWPFTAGQLLWATLTLLTLSWLDRAVAEGETGQPSLRWLAASLACGYGSMHCFGLGLATMAGWTAVWMLLLVETRRRGRDAAYLRRLTLLGVAGLVLTAAHAFLMVRLLPPAPPVPPQPDIGAGQFTGETLGFVACYFFAGVRSLWSPDGWPYPATALIAQEWPYGLGLVLAAAAGAVGWYRAYRARPSAATLGRLCWHVFACAACGLFVLMVAHRIRTGNRADGAWMIYLVVARYLWPGAVLMLGFVLAGLTSLRVRDVRLAVALGLAITACAVAGNVVYQRQVLPQVWPYTSVDHEQSWDQLVAMTRELHAAKLPLPNLSVQTLDVETARPLKEYHSRLRHDAGLPPQERLDWLEGFQLTPVLWRRLEDKSPALTVLARTMFAGFAATVPPAILRALPDPAGGAARLNFAAEPTVRAAIVNNARYHPNLGVDVEVDGTHRHTIWIEPPTSVTFHDVALGEHPAFRVFAAIHPAVQGLGGADGAVFYVDVIVRGRAQRVIEQSIDPYAHPAQKPWNRLSADLSPFAGRRVDIVMGNGPGPQGNDYADWCLWGDPELTQ